MISVRQDALAVAFLVWSWAASQLETARSWLPEPAPRMRGGRARAQTEARTIIASGGATVASGGIVALIKQDLIGGWLYAIALQGVRAISSLGGVGDVIGAFWGGLADLIGVAIPTDIVVAGVDTTALAIRTQFGIAGYVISIIATMTGIAVFLWFLANIDWNPLGIFTGRGGS